MNLYEAFQQALYVPLEREQNWYRASVENVEIEGSGKQMVVMRERGKKARVWTKKKINKL